MGNTKDIAAGLLFVALGGYFAIDAYLHLRIGSAFEMGPGYFPLILGGLLALLGAAIARGGVRRPPEALGDVPWRKLAMVLGAIVLFGITVRGLGFAPALALASLMTARAGGLGWRASALVAVGLTFFSVLAFVEALGLPYRLVGPWLRF